MGGMLFRDVCLDGRFRQAAHSQRRVHTACFLPAKNGRGSPGQFSSLRSIQVKKGFTYV